MKKSDIIKQSIKDNIIDEDAVLQSVLATKPKPYFLPRGLKTAVLCFCLLIICSVAAFPALLESFNDNAAFIDTNTADNTEDAKYSGEINSIHLGSVIPNNESNYGSVSYTDEGISVVDKEESQSKEESECIDFSNSSEKITICASLSSLDYSVYHDFMPSGMDSYDSSSCEEQSTDDSIIEENPTGTEGTDEVLKLPVYLNKHDSKSIKTYYYNEFSALTKAQAYFAVFNRKYAAVLLSGCTIEGYAVSDILYVTGEDCDYYLPFYAVFKGEYVYMVPAIMEEYLVNTAK